MSSPEADVRPGARGSLRGVARESIAFGLREGRAPEVDPREHPEAWRAASASFVTLRAGGELRGCTGTLEPIHPLVVDVARNAYRSAFVDPRFPALRESELPGIDIHVAVLSPLEPLEVASEDDLLAALRPGIDGLVLRDGAAGATFLPAVWESLPDPRSFLEALLHKARLPAGYWSSTLRFQRYTTEDAD